MRTIIETLSIKDARHKYPEGTAFVASISADLRNGYYDNGAMDIESAKVWHIGPGTINWGAHVLAFILKTDPSQEELEKMTLGERMFHVLESAGQPGAGRYTLDSAQKRSLELAKTALEQTTGLSRLQIHLLLSSDDFREQFLSEEEIVCLANISERIMAHFNSQQNATPNSRLVKALTEEPTIF